VNHDVAMAPIIEFREVRYAYSKADRDARRVSGERPTIDGVDLTIEQGEVVVLVGQSGSGKSTLLKLANRLLLPESGTVLVEGRDTREWDGIALRRRTGYVLQGIGLFPHLTIEDNLTLVPRLEEWPLERRRERARELLELVRLPSDFAGRWPSELSGGQQQRVGVARALAVNPPVILMDEPFGALDPVTRNDLRREFRRIQAELQQTALVVTHDMGEAFVLASRVGVLEAGRLIACDTPSAIAHSDDRRVRELLDAATPTAG
jgi:osmoprotectant transport system ATP-binding protein